MTGRRTAVLLADIDVDDNRQLRVCLRYAGDHELEVTTLAGRRPDVALAAARAGADVVLCTVLPDHDADRHRQLAEGLARLRAQLVYARPRFRTPPVDAETALIRTALANSAGNVALVAELLGLPAGRVRYEAAAAGHQRRRQATMRPGAVRAEPGETPSRPSIHVRGVDLAAWSGSPVPVLVRTED